MIIAFQGVKGAYSEIAITKHFGEDAQGEGYATFEEVFDAVRDAKADFAVIPFENNVTGSISINYDLLLKSNLFIIAEVYVPIRHKLLSHPGNSLNSIKTVYSHPQALEQCRDFIKKGGFRAIPEFDTAGSAKLVKERGKSDEAAIASERCAKIYGLDILAQDIDVQKNFVTKFYVLCRKSDVPANQKGEKTLIVFRTKHYPGALVNCLQRLAKNGINLTKLESRPMPDNPGEYCFYVEFLGDEKDENVKLSLLEMGAASQFVRVLGCYPSSKNA